MHELSDDDLQKLGLEKTTFFQRAAPTQSSPEAVRKKRERTRKHDSGFKRLDVWVPPEILQLLNWQLLNEKTRRSGGTPESYSDSVTVTLEIPRNLLPAFRLAFNIESVSGHTSISANNLYTTYDCDETWDVTGPYLNDHAGVDQWISQILSILDSETTSARPAIKKAESTASPHKQAKQPQKGKAELIEIWIGRRFLSASDFWRRLITSVALSAPPPAATAIPSNDSDAYKSGIWIYAQPRFRKWLVLKMLDLAN
jgi:hypothetical protein